jgi:hypothetical protein
MRLRGMILVMAAIMALTSGLSSAPAFDPQLGAPALASIREKVHIPIYDAVPVT